MAISNINLLHLARDRLYTNFQPIIAKLETPADYILMEVFDQLLNATLRKNPFAHSIMEAILGLPIVGDNRWTIPRGILEGYIPAISQGFADAFKIYNPRDREDVWIIPYPMEFNYLPLHLVSPTEPNGLSSMVTQLGMNLETLLGKLSLKRATLLEETSGIISKMGYQGVETRMFETQLEGFLKQAKRHYNLEKPEVIFLMGPGSLVGDKPEYKTTLMLNAVIKAFGIKKTDRIRIVLAEAVQESLDKILPGLEKEYANYQFEFIREPHTFQFSNDLWKRRVGDPKFVTRDEPDKNGWEQILGGEYNPHRALSFFDAGSLWNVGWNPYKYLHEMPPSLLISTNFMLPQKHNNKLRLGKTTELLNRLGNDYAINLVRSQGDFTLKYAYSNGLQAINSGVVHYDPEDVMLYWLLDLGSEHLMIPTVAPHWNFDPRDPPDELGDLMFGPNPNTLPTSKYILGHMQSPRFLKGQPRKIMEYAGFVDTIVMSSNQYQVTLSRDKPFPPGVVELMVVPIFEGFKMPSGFESFAPIYLKR